MKIKFNFSKQNSDLGYIWSKFVQSGVRVREVTPSIFFHHRFWKQLNISEKFTDLRKTWKYSLKISICLKVMHWSIFRPFLNNESIIVVDKTTPGLWSRSRIPHCLVTVDSTLFRFLTWCQCKIGLWTRRGQSCPDRLSRPYALALSLRPVPLQVIHLVHNFGLSA